MVVSGCFFVVVSWCHPGPQGWIARWVRNVHPTLVPAADPEDVTVAGSFPRAAGNGGL